jgi:hypothetical protein
MHKGRLKVKITKILLKVKGERESLNKLTNLGVCNLFCYIFLKSFMP